MAVPMHGVVTSSTIDSNIQLRTAFRSSTHNVH